jgi:hypothetical protein
MSSVRYLGASSWAFFMNAACASLSSLGGGVVRVATGTPTCAKNSSCPAGAHRHSKRTVCFEAFVKECGAFAGMLRVSPARTVDCSPRNVASISPSSRVNDSSKSCRWGGRAAAGRNVHVDQAIPAVGVVAGEQDRVGITDEADVRKALVCVGPRDLEGALWIVRGNRRGGFGSNGVLVHVVVVGIFG